MFQLCMPLFHGCMFSCARLSSWLMRVRIVHPSFATPMYVLVVHALVLWMQVAVVHASVRLNNTRWIR